MQIAELEKGLAGRLGVTRARIGKAWRKAQAAQAEFERRNREEGARILKEVEASGKPAIVILGRPYNTLDLGANLALPQKIADLGLTVIPMDMLPYDIEKLHPYFGNMFWAYGQQMLAAAEFVRHHPNLYGIYFTNFSCGPDSFLLSFAEEMMGAKPFLALELDEHGGDAGYLTRIEAFLDVIRAWTPREQPRFSVPVPETPPEQLEKRTLWIPNMHPIGGPLMAAGLRAGGFERAESLPPETHEAFEIGRSLTRGSECLPTACTTGAFVQVMRSRGLDPKDNALFMPSSDGPCRFGQYNVLQRLIVNRLGLGEVAILSPSCKNSYQGLSQKARQMLWHAILCADTIWKAGCKVRPYEKERGATDRAMHEGVEEVARIMEKGGDFRPAFGQAVRRVAAVPAEKLGTRPLVGIVGEIYVRCNVFSNDEVIRAIERFGGEAWLAPLGEWVLYTAEFHRWVAGRRPLDLPEPGLGAPEELLHSAAGARSRADRLAVPGRPPRAADPGSRRRGPEIPPDELLRRSADHAGPRGGLRAAGRLADRQRRPVRLHARHDHLGPLPRDPGADRRPHHQPLLRRRAGHEPAPAGLPRRPLRPLRPQKRLARQSGPFKSSHGGHSSLEALRR